MKYKLFYKEEELAEIEFYIDVNDFIELAPKINIITYTDFLKDNGFKKSFVADISALLDIRNWLWTSYFKAKENTAQFAEDVMEKVEFFLNKMKKEHELEFKQD